MSSLPYWFSLSGAMSLDRFLNLGTTDKVSCVILCQGVCPLLVGYLVASLASAH